MALLAVILRFCRDAVGGRAVEWAKRTTGNRVAR